MNGKNMMMAAAVAAALTGVAGAALADQTQQGQHDDVTALSSAKVSLAQAVATAEQKAGGKAVRAAFDENDGAPRIAVDVAVAQPGQANGSLTTVLIDPQNGQVTGTRQGEDEENEDGGGE